MFAICIWMLLQSQSFREKLPRLHWDTVLHKSLVVRRYLKKEMRTTLREEAANLSQDPLEITGIELGIFEVQAALGCPHGRPGYAGGTSTDG